MLYKFSVIRALVLCLCLVISSNDADFLRDKRRSRVLVLGAGMSGISSAKALHDAGIQNIMILEASSRTGGRIKQATLGNYTVELGAMWIYGRGTNPVYRLAQEANISFTDNFADDWTIRDESGNDVTEYGSSAFSKLKRAMTDTHKLGKRTKSDYTVSAALRNSAWRARNEIDDIIESYLLDFETGVPPDSLDMKKLHLKDTFSDFGNFDMLAVNHDNGFADVVEKLRTDFMAEDDHRIAFNKRVNVIKHDSDSVTVLTDDGDIFEADYVVVTFSLGVLQHREVEFVPALPLQKQRAIDMFGFSRFSHIYIQFPYTFWDNTMYVLRASKMRGHFSFWQNMNTIYPESNILQLSLFGDDSTWVERSEDEVILQKILTVLKSIYPNVTIPTPTGMKLSRWNSDPFTRGAFSFWPVGFSDEDMTELQAPVGRVFFAGEHLDPLHYGFVHGAYRSGSQTAKSLIQCIGLPAFCVSNCHGNMTNI